jgi:prevent-host-death family protein
MPKSIGVRELRQNLSRYLLRVKAGEPLAVTERGRVIARLVPAGPGLDRYSELSERFGATAPRERVGEIAARIASSGAPAGATDAALAEGRRERS